MTYWSCETHLVREATRACGARVVVETESPTEFDRIGVEERVAGRPEWSDRERR